MEARRLGDNAVTEGWAMLLELVVNDPAWLERRLDFARPDEFASEAATGLLYFVRRYAAKFLYELELHGAPTSSRCAQRYVERMHDALKIEVSRRGLPRRRRPRLLLVELPARLGLRVARSARFLREEFGRAWFTRPRGGLAPSRALGEGQRPTADELLDEVAGAELDARRGRGADRGDCRT